MQASYNTEYVLAFVEEELARLAIARDNLIADRKAIDFANLTLYQALTDNLTQNFGEIMALSKIKGRLQAMIEITEINRGDR